MYNQNGITVERSKHQDICPIAIRLRQIDIDEIWASDRKRPYDAVLESFAKSSHCYTVKIEGIPAIIFGVCPIDQYRGVVWMLATDDIDRIGLRFVRHSRRYIQEFLQEYKLLFNYTHAKNKIALDWLKLCGAKISEPQVHGPDNEMFCYFEFSNTHVVPKQEVNLEARKQILQFQHILSQMPGAKFGDSDLCPLKHSFADGIYVREIFIPKGTFIVGKIHKHEHPNFLMKGKVQVYTEQEGLQELIAPLAMISKPGTKRVVYAVEDTTWITVHSNVDNTQDLEKIEDFVIAKDYNTYALFRKQKERELLCHGH